MSIVQVSYTKTKVRNSRSELNLLHRTKFLQNSKLFKIKMVFKNTTMWNDFAIIYVIARASGLFSVTTRLCNEIISRTYDINKVYSNIQKVHWRTVLPCQTDDILKTWHIFLSCEQGNFTYVANLTQDSAWRTQATDKNKFSTP